MSSISDLRTALAANKPVELFPAGSDIKDATALVVDGKSYPLDAKTGFVSEENGEDQLLKAIYQVWLHRDSSTTDYLADCELKGIPVVNFLERTDLLSFLSEAADECKYIKEFSAAEKESDAKSAGAASAGAGGAGAVSAGAGAAATKETAEGASKKHVRIEADANKENKRQKIIDSDPFLKQVLANERDVVDHNKALRGSKLGDFSNVAKEVEYKIIRESKSGHLFGDGKSSSSSSSSLTKKSGTAGASGSASDGAAVAGDNLSRVLKKGDPIIILSPSASALINMGNVKSFLEDGKFVEPESLPVGAPNMLKVVRQSKRFNRPIKFVVVNNVDKFFTKPEHWDRVVAVFTTGQEWQFKNYRESQPNELFQKVKGYFVHYNGDPVPENIKNWNLEVIPIERTRRFKDRQTSEALWESLEKFMAARGYK